MLGQVAPQASRVAERCGYDMPGVVKGKKYFFKNRFEKFQNDFSNFETPSLAVSKFRNAQKKKRFQNAQKKKNCFHILQNDFFRFQSSERFYSFSSRFQYENENLFVFTKIQFAKSHRFQMFQNDFFRFPAVFSMKTKKFLFSPKFFFFQNLIVFKCFKTIFSVFQPFYEIPKRLEKQFCSRFKIQNAYQKLKST